MGVRGLTSFIARHAELYLRPYELHDTHLVIDGDNLACNLYKDVTGTYSAFGGDYDDFYRSVVEFFHVLAECNVHAYVLMDGGYERRKLRTVAQRLRGKIAIIKKINPCGSVTVFPLLMKEVFVDAVRSCGVPVMRCVFEADDELAALGRKLNCPVLSYDSDFYIHNVRYIPLITLTPKALTKRKKSDCHQDEQRKLHRNEKRAFQKRTASQRIISDIAVDNVMRRAPKDVATSYKYLDCCLYRVENLIARDALSAEKLPLFAALLGNDYIARSAFRNFFQAGMMGKAGRSKKMKQQQRRIRVILQWLKNETAATAMEKILTRLKKSQRESLEAQVRAATSGYLNETCRSYDFFAANYESAFQEFDATATERNEDQSNEGENSADNVEVVNGTETDDESESDDEADAEEEEEENSDASDSEAEENENDAELASSDNENDDDAIDVGDKIERLPAWFLDKLYPAHLPRYFVDLMHLRKYINSPQIEHFPYNDCNEIALPILVYIFTLLHTAEGEPPPPKKLADDGTEVKTSFTYMARATRVTNICYTRFELLEEQSLKYKFNPLEPNPLLLRHVFESSMRRQLNTDTLFEQVAVLPKDLQLYMLAVVFWLQKSQHCDLWHLHALLICAVVLRTIDSKIPAERDLKAFQKRFGKIIKRERLVREKERLSGIKRDVKEDLKSLPVPARMAFIPQSDCYLVQDELLKHFHMQEIFKKKYDLYSSTVIHAFAELQCVVFHLYGLNALLDAPYEPSRMGQLYCGVFLYNMYDLLRSRQDVRYHVQHFIFHDSQMMFDFYTYLWQWCEPFIPHWKQSDATLSAQAIQKKLLKKQRQAARKKAATAESTSADPNADMLDSEADNADGVDDEDFYDLNNKFCAFLNIK